MAEIRSINHTETGHYVHLKDLLGHLVELRDQAFADGERGVSSVWDRLIVDLATPFMIRDNVKPTGPVNPDEVTAETLHTEPEQGDAHQ